MKCSPTQLVTPSSIGSAANIAHLRQLASHFEKLPRRNQDRLKPYLYAANYTVSSIDEAYQLLREYLYTNGVTAVEDLRFPNRGKIEVIPGAAWCEVQASIKADGETTEHNDRLAS